MKGKQAKGWFLTWAQCDWRKEDALEALKKTGDIQEYVICEEKHQDGSPHLHAFIKYETKKRFNAHKWDLGEHHGNYQVAKSWKACSEYVKKDGNYIANINLENIEKKQAKKIMPEDYGRDPLDLLDEGVINFMNLKNFVRNQELYLMLKRKRDRGTEDYSDMPTDKQRHVWVHGESNTGKTEKLAEMISAYGNSNCFQIPPNNDWTGYTNERILYFDEYKGQLSIQDLNRICDGNAKMNTKGGTIQIVKYPQVVIISNYDIGGCYSKAGIDLLNTLHNRFNVIQLVKDPNYKKD